MDWKPIETAPLDGSHFLAWCVDTVDEYDEDNRLIARGVKEAYAVVAYYFTLGFGGEFVQFPWTGSFVQNRRFTHWQPLPAPPDLSPPIGLTQAEDLKNG